MYQSLEDTDKWDTQMWVEVDLPENAALAWGVALHGVHMKHSTTQGISMATGTSGPASHSKSSKDYAVRVPVFTHITGNPGSMGDDVKLTLQFIF